MVNLYKLFIALALCVFGATNVNAEDTVPLSPDMFFAWDGWGADAQKTGPADCIYVLNESTGQCYGDPSVINYADLSLYSKLIVTVTEGTPRFLFNRTVDEGQYNANEAESNLLEYPKNGWTDRFFTKDGDDYIVDLKMMTKEKGFAHLHAIKGANWANLTVTKMELVPQGKTQVVGWTDLITNGNLEGDDVSCFYSKENAGSPFPSVITDGAGVDESRGIIVHSAAGAAQDWDAQFWINLPETLPEGTKYRVSFAYRASKDATVDTQAHADPSDYIHYEMIGSPNFTTDWQVYNYEGTITAQQAGPNGNGGLLHSIAFNLSKDKANDIDFYFDNIKFEVYKYGTVAEFSDDVIQIDFGFETNIPELVKACGKRRLMFPESCVSVNVKGDVKPIYSVEGFDDGRFYIFLDEALMPSDEVEVSFSNPSDAAYHLTYTSGPGGDVNNFTGIASYSMEIQDNDGYPYAFLTPIIMQADPEDGSFNLPNSLKEIKVVFDKLVDCAALDAKLGKEKLSVSPASGFAEEVTLIRNSANDLNNGEHTVTLTKIYPELRLDDSIYGEETWTINVGQVVVDPNDVPKDMLPDYFATAPANGIPDGYLVVFGEENRVAPNTYSSGARMFDFAAGGDFTKGLYFRSDYVEFGGIEGYALPLEAGKRYDIHFNAAAWKDNGTYMKFEVLNANEEIVYETVVKTVPNVNGNTSAAVTGSTSFTTKFVPETDGNYLLRWRPATNENGDQGGFNEVLLANPSVRYMPNIAGVEETQLLALALENAKKTLADNSASRYSGPAYDALKAAIDKYEAEGATYTAPSAYRNAAADLDACSQALKDHRALCDTYDPLPVQAQKIVDDNAEKKFAATALYAKLKEVAAKYIVKVQGTEIDPETGEEVLVDEYRALEIKDDAELQAAITELKDLVNTTGLLFTEGASQTSDTGVKVLTERLRLGAEALKSLGAADDPLVAAANNALTDDDNLALGIQNKLKVILYEQLKNPDNQLFASHVDETTLEEVTPTYDMTVFVKNPNIYKQQNSMNFTAENVPGWVTPEGYSAPGLSVGWGQPRGNDEIAEDCMFQTWGSSYRVEQTITNAPVGVYTLKIGFGERMNEDEANFQDSYIYAKTSATPEGENGQTGDCPGIGQSFPYANAVIENIVVVDGVITIGANAGPSSHTFFNDVRLLLAGPAAGFDYAAAYQEAVEGIDPETAKPAEVRAVALYDINGRRILTAQKGVMIVKKWMSDGTIRVEKVVKR